MANTIITITVIDAWPKLRLEILRGPNLRREGPTMYDIATTSFEPAVRDALRLAVEEVTNSHKRS